MLHPPDLQSTPKPHDRSPHRIPIVRITLVILTGAVLVGCQALLPRASDDTVVQWKSFDEAREFIERIEPYQTTRNDLAGQGIDPFRTPSVTLLSYPDIVQRLSLIHI